MLHAVTWIALILSGISFLLFIVFSGFDLWAEYRARSRAPPPAEHEVRLQAAGPEQFGKLAEALGKAVESVSNAATALKKAGPAATAAALSFAFLLVALVAAGLDLVPDAKDDNTKPITLKIDALEKKFITRFDALEARFDALESKVKEQEDQQKKGDGLTNITIQLNAIQSSAAKIATSMTDLELAISEALKRLFARADEPKRGRRH
jgi:hypothetical protein